MGPAVAGRASRLTPFQLQSSPPPFLFFTAEWQISGGAGHRAARTPTRTTRTSRAATPYPCYILNKEVEIDVIGVSRLILLNLWDGETRRDSGLDEAVGNLKLRLEFLQQNALPLDCKVLR